MKTFLFETVATMKPHNRRKWWIDSDIIKRLKIEAENVSAALEHYREIVTNKFYIDISKNALKNKSPMYQDNANGEPQQVGFVITASTEFDNDRREWTKQFIDLWVNVSTVENPFRTEAAQ